MNVVGLDLSTKRIGFAAADGELLSIKGHAGADDPYRRLHELTRELAHTFTLRPPKPDLVVLEDYSLASPGRIALIRLGEIGGVTRMRLFELDIGFALVRPASLKRFATGNGNANKEQMVSRAIELGARGSINDDEADAFHLRRMGRAVHGLEGQLLDFELDAIVNAGISWGPA
jgi:Holliday junction resolvasome RuvABC endonuclease subunit